VPTVILSKEDFLKEMESAIPDGCVVIVSSDVLEAVNPFSRKAYFEVKTGIPSNIFRKQEKSVVIPKASGGKSEMTLTIVVCNPKLLTEKAREVI